MSKPIKISFESLVSDVFNQLAKGYGVICVGMGKQRFSEFFDKVCERLPQNGNDSKLISREGCNGDFFMITETQKDMTIIPFYRLHFTAQEGYAPLEIVYS